MFYAHNLELLQQSMALLIYQTLFTNPHITSQQKLKLHHI